MQEQWWFQRPVSCKNQIFNLADIDERNSTVHYTHWHIYLLLTLWVIFTFYNIFVSQNMVIYSCEINHVRTWTWTDLDLQGPWKCTGFNLNVLPPGTSIFGGPSKPYPLLSASHRSSHALRNAFRSINCNLHEVKSQRLGKQTWFLILKLTKER